MGTKQTRKVMLTDNQQNRLVFLLFLVSLLLVTCFHEITLDESQAWMIARDASLKEIIFQIPHYEGHPFLWHLLLVPFAKTGVAPGIGLHFWMVLISATAVYILLFKSPFPKVIRYLLPFTYYIFYRYTVVARPYCITFLAFVLAAYYYKERNNHPIRYALALMLLSASTAYGMVFAAGICFVWAMDLIKAWKNKEKVSWIAVFGSVALLIAQNVFQLILIMPKTDTNAANLYDLKTYLFSFIYMICIAPADSMFLDSGMDARLQNYAQQIVTGSFNSIIYLVLGILTTSVIIAFFYKRKKLNLFLIPYLMFSAFAAVVYLWYHHIGLVFLFLLFAVWCAWENKTTENTDVEPIKKDCVEAKKTNRKLFAIMGIIMGLGVSIAWNVYDCGIDMKYPIWYNKMVADAIREVGADQENCVLQWTYHPKGTFDAPEEYFDSNNYTYELSLTCFYDCLVYFDSNIFYNHNEGNPEISYSMQTVYKGEKEEQLRETLAAKGYPEFIIGNYIVLGYLPIEEEKPMYCPVYRFEVRKPDKFMVDYNDQFIYARQDIYMSRNQWPINEQMTIK